MTAYLTKVLFITSIRDKGTGKYKKIIVLLISYLISSSVIYYVNSLNFDKISFTLLALLTDSFIISFAFINEFRSLFLNRGESEFLNSLPIPASTIVLSKLAASISYLTVIIFMLLFPKLYFFASYLPQFFEYMLFSFTIISGAVIFCIFILSAYIILFQLKPAVSGFLLYSLQLSFVVLVILSASLKTKGLIRHSIMDNPWIHYLPHTYFAMTIQKSEFFILQILLLLAASFIFYIILKKYSAGVSENLDKVKASRSMPAGFITKTISSLYGSSSYIIAGYELIKHQLKNSRFLKMRYTPLLLMPVIFALSGLFINSAFLFLESSSLPLEPVFSIISPTLTFMLFFTSRMMYSASHISEENSFPVDWIYYSAPLQKLQELNKGVSLYLLLNFTFPVLGVYFLCLFVKTSFADAILNVVFLISAVVLSYSVLSYSRKNLPFTLRSGIINSASRLAEMFFSLVITLIVFVIQLFIFKSVILILATAALLLYLSLLLNRKTGENNAALTGSYTHPN